MSDPECLRVQKNTNDPQSTPSNGSEEAPLYYGRWTVEEERYAEMMIKEFQDGNLDEADFEGAPNTLRGYLAHKLNCAPKRISKKFECSGYNGRMQYVFQSSNLAPEEAKIRRQTLENLRQEFQARRQLRPKKPTQKKSTSVRNLKTEDESVPFDVVGAARKNPPAWEAALASSPTPVAGTPNPVGQSYARLGCASVATGILDCSSTDAIILAPQATAPTGLRFGELAAAAFVSSSAVALGHRDALFTEGIFDHVQRNTLCPSGGHPALVETMPRREASLISSLISSTNPVQRDNSGDLLANVEALQRIQTNLLLQQNASETLRLQEVLNHRKRIRAALAMTIETAPATGIGRTQLLSPLLQQTVDTSCRLPWQEEGSAALTITSLANPYGLQGRQDAGPAQKRPKTA